MKNYEHYVQNTIDLLKNKQICTHSINSHKICYQKFREFSLEKELIYNQKNVNYWLDYVRITENRQTCYAYRNYMEQLVEIRSTGTISDMHLSLVTSFYDKLEGTLKIDLDDYLNHCKVGYSKNTHKHAKIYCSRILLYFKELGINDITDITYEDIDIFYKLDFHCDKKTRYVYLSHARKLFVFFATKEKCKRGFGIIIDDKMYHHVGWLINFSNKNSTRINKISLESREFPSDEFFNSIDDFIENMVSNGYATTPICVARRTLTLLFIFLERNNLGYLPEISWIWFEEIKNVIGASWSGWRRILKMYEEYVFYGNIIVGSRYLYRNAALDNFPCWCREQILNFQERLRRELKNENTVNKSKYSCMRFCSFIISHGIEAFRDITPELIIEFSIKDEHETFKGRSSYFSGIRQFLYYLEDVHMIDNPYLHKLLSPGKAPSEEIVDILALQEEDDIRKYREMHTAPIELRSSAMVMVGLRLGLRASDVVNLKISDINWKYKTVSFTQTKTKIPMILPLGIDVGNAIYLYFKNGRPDVDSPYIFIRHTAPYGKLTTKICNDSLYRILPNRAKVYHKGFHVTRRTFATNILRNNAGISTVIDSLGHQDNTSVMKYLSFDEERMNLCPLELSECGIELKGGLVL